MKRKQLYKPNFFFNTLEYFEDLIFGALKSRTKKERLDYLLHLRDRCQREIDVVFMKNRKSEIFKLVDDIENSDD